MIWLVVRVVPLQCMIAIFLCVLLMFYHIFSVQATAKLFESADSFFSTGGQGFEQVILWAVLLVAMRFLQSLIIFGNGINGNVYLCGKTTNYFRQQLAKKVTKLPLISFEDAYVNDMLKRAQEVVEDERLSDQFRSILDIVNSCFASAGIAVVLAGYHPLLLVIAIPSVLPFFVMRMIRGKEFYRLKYFQAKTKRNMDYYWGLLFHKNSMKEILVYDFADYIRKKWSLYRDDVDEKTWEFRKKDSEAVLLLNGISVVGYLISILFSVYLVFEGHMNIGVLGACLSAFLTMQSKTKNFLIDVGSIFEDLQFNQDYLDFLNLPEMADGTVVLDSVPEAIELRHVSFRYPNGKEYAVRDVSLKIQKGESVVLVGENGSGKTTLVKLLLGLYECESGEILFDGVPISQINKESLYRMLSLMMQSSIKLKATVREAVALSEILDKDNDQKIIDCMKMAKIDYILDENGLDARLGKEFGGLELSGGEWQRLALARALFKNSELVVLDEPTSAIDPITEMEMLSAFLENFQGKTSIIVSHRVGICTRADKVLLLKDGQVAEYGSHQELMERRGEYFELFTAQAKWYT